MEARYHDGLTARAHAVEVRLDGDALTFEADGDAQRWPLAGLEAETIDDRVRLRLHAGEAKRLTLSLADWRTLNAHDATYEQAHRRREIRLIVGLAAAAAAVAGVVFVGIPILSGPLARATPPDLERQIGANLNAQVSLGFPACGGKPGQAALAAFGRRLQGQTHTPFDIRIRAVHAPIVNAFALPGGDILVTDRLIALTESPDELGAVLAHETSHVAKRHVMQGVWRSFGFGVVLDAVVGGGSGAGQQAVLLVGSFTNLRYGRAAEAEADAGGQDLLQAEGLSSEGMAPFFERLTAKGESRDAAAVKELLSDHPDTLHRAQMSRARARPGAPAFSPDDWTAVKAACKDGYNPLQRLRRYF